MREAQQTLTRKYHGAVNIPTLAKGLSNDSKLFRYPINEHYVSSQTQIMETLMGNETRKPFDKHIYILYIYSHPFTNFIVKTLKRIRQSNKKNKEMLKNKDDLKRGF